MHNASPTRSSKNAEQDPDLEENPLSPRYSVFTYRQKRILAVLMGLAMMFAPLTANIYLPCLPALKDHFKISPFLLDIVITSGTIFQGAGPAIFGELSDKVGRRPVFLFCFLMYVAASMGIALQDNYFALLVLKMFQGLGSTATSAVGYGVIADIASPAERGAIIGPALVVADMGLVLAPLIGGPLGQRYSTTWVSLFLTILGASFFLLLAVFLPETGRNLVGNGSIDAGDWNKPLSRCLIPPVKTVPREKVERTQSIPRRIIELIPNPFRSWRLFFSKDIGMVLLLAGVFDMSLTMVLVSLPTLFAEQYGLDQISMALCYIMPSMGLIAGGYFNGTSSPPSIHNSLLMFQSSSQNNGLELPYSSPRNPLPRRRNPRRRP